MSWLVIHAEASQGGPCAFMRSAAAVWAWHGQLPRLERAAARQRMGKIVSSSQLRGGLAMATREAGKARAIHPSAEGVLPRVCDVQKVVLVLVVGIHICHQRRCSKWGGKRRVGEEARGRGALLNPRLRALHARGLAAGWAAPAAACPPVHKA